MAIGKASDMIIYQEEFQSGMIEKVTQFLGVFNEGSRGAIRLVPNALKGDYNKNAFFKDIATLVTRRDTTSTAAVTDLAMTQGEQIGVKLNRKIGPVAQTLDAMKKAGLNEESASRVFGELAGIRKMKDMVNAAILAVETAISGTATLVTDVTAIGAGLVTPTHLQSALAPMGDAAGEIICWLGHSKVNSDVVKGLLTSNVTGLTDIVTLQGGIPAYLGRPQIITDAPALVDAGSPNTYNTLGLTADAVTVEESEVEDFITERVSGAENIFRRWQAEYAFNVSVKGYKWLTATGANPADATLGTNTNWVRIFTDDKLLAGVRLVSK